MSEENNPYEATSNQTEISASYVEILTNIFTAPSKAMRQIQTDYAITLPLLTLLGFTGAVIFIYYTSVDYDWMVDYMVQSAAGDISKAEQNQMKDAFNIMSPTAMAIVSAISATIFIAIIYVIQTVYLLIVSNVNNDGFDFKQWLSFISWSAMPSLLANVAILAVIFSSSNGQIPPDALNPLSLNQLLFEFPSSNGIGKLLETIHLPQIWSLVVMIIGYKVWTNKSSNVSTAIILAPFILIYAIWALFI